MQTKSIVRKPNFLDVIGYAIVDFFTVPVIETADEANAAFTKGVEKIEASLNALDAAPPIAPAAPAETPRVVNKKSQAKAPKAAEPASPVAEAASRVAAEDGQPPQPGVGGLLRTGEVPVPADIVPCDPETGEPLVAASTESPAGSEEGRT